MCYVANGKKKEWSNQNSVQEHISARALILAVCFATPVRICAVGVSYMIYTSTKAVIVLNILFLFFYKRILNFSQARKVP